MVYEATPALSSVSINHQGKSIQTPPDWRTAPEFEWIAVTEEGLTTSVLMDGPHMMIFSEVADQQTKEVVRLWATVEVLPWQYDGEVERPHSWTDVVEGMSTRTEG